MKFRKRPIVIEAVQFNGKNHQEINQFMGANAFPLQWEPDAIKIQTLEGTMTACSGDWIIQGVNGEFYPCKNEIFEKTYDSISVDPSNPLMEALLRLHYIMKRDPVAWGNPAIAHEGYTIDWLISVEHTKTAGYHGGALE